MTLTGLSVLLAEDNPTNQMVAVQMLEALGATVTLANDGAEALELLEDAEYDVGLIDIEMPRVSGLEFIRTVRANGEASANMPLIALTAYVMREHRQAIEAAGADGVIAKPILSIDAFGEDILGFMRTRGANASGGAAQSSPSPATRETPDADIDREVFGRLLDSLGTAAKPEFLRRVTADMTSARDDIKTAVAARNWPQLCATTHILISVGGSLGAMSVQNLARCLNSAGHTSDDSVIARDAPMILGEIDNVLAFVRGEAAKE